jgi:hypothetical protein
LVNFLFWLAGWLTLNPPLSSCFCTFFSMSSNLLTSSLPHYFMFYTNAGSSSFASCGSDFILIDERRDESLGGYLLVESSRSKSSRSSATKARSKGFVPSPSSISLSNSYLSIICLLSMYYITQYKYKSREKVFYYFTHS